MNCSVKGLSALLADAIQFRRCYNLTGKSIDLLLEPDLEEAGDLLVLVKVRREKLPCHFHAENLGVLTD